MISCFKLTFFLVIFQNKQIRTGPYQGASAFIFNIIINDLLTQIKLRKSGQQSLQMT
jgi:hypothetical protein